MILDMQQHQQTDKSIAENKMIKLLTKAPQQPLDSNFYINQGCSLKPRYYYKIDSEYLNHFLLLTDKQDNQQQILLCMKTNEENYSSKDWECLIQAFI